MSENKRYPDRSWSHDVWEVLETNATHALIKNAAPRYPNSFGADPMIVLISEFDWTDADVLHAAMADFALANRERVQ